MRLYFYVAAAIILWSSSFPSIRVALRAYAPLELATLRFFFCALALLFLVRKRPLTLPRWQDWSSCLFFLLAGVCIFAYQIFLNVGTQKTNSGIASFAIISFSPIFAAFVARFVLSEPLEPTRIIGCLVALIGVYFIAMHDHTLMLNTGIIYLGCAIACWSIYLVFQKKLVQKTDAITTTCVTLWMATIFFLLVNTPQGTIRAIINGGFWPLLHTIYLGVFTTAIAYFLWSCVLEKWGSTTTAVYMYFIPFLTSFLDYLFLNERYTLSFYVGGAFIIGGVILTHPSVLFFHKKQKQPQPYRTN